MPEMWESKALEEWNRSERGKPEWLKLLAILLYSMKKSIRSIARLVKVSPKTILDWIREFGISNNEESFKSEIVELDGNVGSFFRNIEKNSLLILNEIMVDKTMEMFKFFHLEKNLDNFIDKFYNSIASLSK